MRVEGCPDISLPHRGLNMSLRVSASTVEVKRARCVRSSTNSLSGAWRGSAGVEHVGWRGGDEEAGGEAAFQAA